MRSKNDKVLLIIGAYNKKEKLCSYVVQLNNSIDLQIIDATKNIDELKNFDELYSNYINDLLFFFLGEKALETIGAVICYSMENDFKNTFIKKLNSQCLIIDYSKANMTEEELFKNIVSFDKRLLEKSDIYQNGLFILKGAQNRHSIFAQLPKEILSSIVDFYSGLAKKNDTFRFFTALDSPVNTLSPLIQNEKN